MGCFWNKELVDYVPYGSTNVPMTSNECQYEGKKDVSGDCNSECPAYLSDDEAPGKYDTCEEV